MLNDTTGWQNWGTTAPTNTWPAIGIGYNIDRSFLGTFDGAGYVISGVYTNATSHQGLFGRIAQDGTIKNLGVVASYIKGSGYSGGLVGINFSGIIINSYFIGTVNCNAAGGLVGDNDGGTIINSYSAGRVNRISSSGGVGGLVYRNEGTVVNSYYDKETSGQIDTGKGEGKTTSEMQSREFADYLNFTAGILSMNAWNYEQGKYPKLSNELASENGIASYFASGNGTEANPYIIKTKEHLKKLSEFVNVGKNFSNEYFKLGNDISLNDTTGWQDWGTTKNAKLMAPDYSWVAIGNSANSFAGNFNGDGYIISGVYINKATDYQGLFGFVNNTGNIKNVGVVASYINGDEKEYVGGLAGGNTGTISNSYFTGTVHGGYDVGGLVGYNGGTISNCYSTSAVSSASENNGFSDYVGGLVGYNSSGTISNCYSNGIINSDNDYVGGLVGYNNYDATVSNSYYNAQSSGLFDTGKGTGKSTLAMKSQDTYIDWDFENIWGIDTKVNNGYPYLLLGAESEPGESSSSSSDDGDSSSSSDDGDSSSSSKDEPSSSSGEDGDSSSSGGYEKVLCKVGNLELELSEEECELAGGSIVEGNTPIMLPQIASANNIASIKNGLHLAATSSATVKIFNIQGTLISSQNYANGVYNIPLAHLPKGMYVAKVSFGSENKVIRTIVR